MAIFNSYVSHYQRVTGLDFTVAMIQGSSRIIAQWTTARWAYLEPGNPGLVLDLFIESHIGGILKIWRMWLLWFSINVYIYLSLFLLCGSTWNWQRSSSTKQIKTDDLIKNTSHFVSPSVSDSSFPRRWLTSLACKIGMKRLPPSPDLFKKSANKADASLGFFSSQGFNRRFPLQSSEKSEKKNLPIAPTG